MSALGQAEVPCYVSIRPIIGLLGHSKTNKTPPKQGLCNCCFDYTFTLRRLNPSAARPKPKCERARFRNSPAAFRTMLSILSSTGPNENNLLRM